MRELAYSDVGALAISCVIRLLLSQPAAPALAGLCTAALLNPLLHRIVCLGELMDADTPTSTSFLWLCRQIPTPQTNGVT